MRAHEDQASGHGHPALRPAGMPADWGFTPLGLLMELAGLFFLVAGAVVATLALLMVVQGGAGAWLFALFAGTAIARSELHRRAGRALVYGDRDGRDPARDIAGDFLDDSFSSPTSGQEDGGPAGRSGGRIRPLQRYLRFAIIHSLVGPLLLIPSMGQPDGMATAVLLAGLLLSWPLAVFVMARRTPYWQRVDETIPAAEDNGYESLAIYMIVMWAAGALIVASLPLWLLPGGAGGHLVVAVPVVALLAFRSWRHLQTALCGLRGVGGEEFEDRGMRYSNLAILVAIAAGAGVFVAALVGQTRGPWFIAAPLGAFWVLFVWPRIVAQFLQTRSYAHFVESDGSPLQRAPDRGLTALGWLLLASGVTGLAKNLVVIIGAQLSVEWLEEVWLAVGEPVGMITAIVAGAAQVWAGVEILGATRRASRAVLVYAVVGICGALVLGWDQLRLLTELGPRALARSGIEPALTALFNLVPAMVLPIAALALTRRQTILRAQVVSGA